MRYSDGRQIVLTTMHVCLQINSEYNKPEIILQVFPSEVTVGVLTRAETANYLQYIRSLYNQTQAEGRTNVHLLLLNGTGLPVDHWCANHPSAAADANIASQLHAFITTKLPDWAKSTYPLIPYLSEFEQAAAQK